MRTGAGVGRANALHIPLRDRSVHLIVVSPPFFSLRIYADGGAPLDDQIGNELSPKHYLANLWGFMAEAWRVLADDGSVIVELGDKRVGYSGTKWGHGRSLGSTRGETKVPATGPKGAPAIYGAPNKSLLGLPDRFIVGLLDGEGAPDGCQWVWREDIAWGRHNGMPESVVDRCRASHSRVFHLTKRDRYYANMDEIREPYAPRTQAEENRGSRLAYLAQRHGKNEMPAQPGTYTPNPLGKLPGTVWMINTEPLVCPDYMVDDDGGWKMMDAPALWQYATRRVREGATDIQVRSVDHWAAFPVELPRRLILAFSPPAICTACGQGRRSVVTKDAVGRPRRDGSRRGDAGLPGYDNIERTTWNTDVSYRITGESCGCAEPTAATRPAIVLDFFSGSGTTAMTARALGRFGIGLDLSMDYCRLSSWRIWDSGHDRKVQSRTNAARQLSIFDAAPAVEVARRPVSL